MTAAASAASRQCACLHGRLGGKERRRAQPASQLYGAKLRGVGTLAGAVRLDDLALARRESPAAARLLHDKTNKGKKRKAKGKSGAGHFFPFCAAAFFLSFLGCRRARLMVKGSLKQKTFARRFEIIPCAEFSRSGVV